MLKIIKNSCYDLIGAYFRTPSLSLGNHQFKINSTRSAIFIIDICIDNRPFKVFINRKEEGLEISNVVMLERPIDWEDVACEHGVNEVAMK